MGILFRLRIHESAESDLDAIATVDADAAAFLLTFLEELEGDQDLLDRLTQHGYHVRASDDWAANFNVEVWAAQQQRGRNLWRLKSWELEAGDYRVIYAFQALRRVYVVLGVFHRSGFNYECDSPLGRRIAEDYESL